MRLFLAVFVGGGLGSLLRYVLQLAWSGRAGEWVFPWSTFGINVLGSFCIGLFGVLVSRLCLPDEVRLFLVTGLCGGFTTFSTFSNEGLVLLRQGLYGSFLAYAVGSLVLGLAAAFAGCWAGGFVHGR